MSKPIIGISSSSLHIGINTPISRHISFVNEEILAAVYDHHATPIIIPSFIDIDQISNLVSRLDGIILSGGQDVSPCSYNQQQQVIYTSTSTIGGTRYSRPTSIRPNPKRDKTEIQLYHSAKWLSIPILGICRGMQIINVAEGGTLYQELPLQSSSIHERNNEGDISYHPVYIKKDSLMHQIFQTSIYESNSMHHQAIDKLGNNLQATGKASDETIEFIEGTDASKFIIGIQGHPEKPQRCDDLFKAFVEQCIKMRKPLSETLSNAA